MKNFYDILILTKKIREMEVIDKTRTKELDELKALKNRTFDK